MFRDLLTRTSAYSVSLVVGRLAAFLLLPLYTRYLTPADYGILELLDLLTAVFGLIMGVQLGQGLFYYYFAAQSQEEKARWINAGFVGSFLFGGICIALGVGCSRLLSGVVFGTTRYATFVSIGFLVLGLSLPIEVGRCCLRVLDRPRTYVWTTVAGTAIGILLNVVFLVGYHAQVKGMLVSALLTSIALAAFSILSIWPSPRSARLSAEVGAIIKYSLPLVLSGLAVFLIHYGDRVFLRTYVSLDVLGVYSLAYKIGMSVAFIHQPFIMHWNAHVCEIVQGVNGDRTFARATTYLTAILTSGALALSILCAPALRLTVGSGFWGAATLVPLLATAYLIRALGAHLQSVFIVAGKPGLEARVNTVGSLACVVAYAVLIPRFKAAGAAWATLIGFTVILLYGFWQAQRLRAFPFEYGRLARIALLALAAGGSFYLVRPSDVLRQAAVGCVFCGAFAVALWAGCLDGGERTELKRLLVDVCQKVLSERQAKVVTT
jgi:O-antigen/teichoic acid export membrane protein